MRLDLSPGHYAGVGKFPSISVNKVPSSASDVMVLLLAGESYCYNNEVANKRPYPALCDSVPQSMPGVLTYTYGTFEAFADALDAGHVLNPCIPTGARNL